MRTPAVNQPFIVKIMKTFNTLSGTHLVHRESRALPVAGGTEFFSCSRMIPPCSCVHSQACFRNSSRLRSALLIPCAAASRFTTFASVAMEAWSVPAPSRHFAHVRARRTSTSCMVLFSMCPMYAAHRLHWAVELRWYKVHVHRVPEWKNCCPTNTDTIYPPLPKDYICLQVPYYLLQFDFFKT